MEIDSKSRKILLTPILFMVFNRLDTTKKVFYEIRKAKPKKLYIASDGPRLNKVGENQQVDAVRDFIISNIDWDCQVKTLFREKNLGCKYACSSAIDWFFKNEEMGIILEDDCLPNQSFFNYCQLLLNKYKDDLRIGQISGTNFQNGIKRGNADYYFSNFHNIWGWATWANRWENYDLELDKFNDAKYLNDILDSKNAIKDLQKTFNLIKYKNLNTWGYQLSFSLWAQNQIAIIPNANLIKNIGFGNNATHTFEENEFSNLKQSQIEINNHPKEVKINKEADDYLIKILYSRPITLKRVIRKLKRILKITDKN